MMEGERERKREREKERGMERANIFQSVSEIVTCPFPMNFT